MKSVVVLTLLLLIPEHSCTTYEVIRHNYPGIDDHKIFASRTIEKSPTPFQLNKMPGKASLLETLMVKGPNNKEVRLEEFLRDSKTVALIVIKDDAIVYEKYFGSHSEQTLINSFSVTKSFISALVGIAISEGYIKSVDQTVADFLPEFKTRPYGNITIRNLLQMTSGIKFSFNGYSPFADNARFYYGDNLREMVAKLKAGKAQGKQWKYKESDPQMLGLILERATGRSLSKYLEEKIWSPLGMEFDASWSLDSSNERGMEKAFCCLNARARDFARFGLLYLNMGQWQGKQVVPRDWVETSMQADETRGGAPNHKYLWWLPLPREDDFFADGNLGQFIYVNRPHKVVIVKLSEKNARGVIPMFRKIASALDQ